jgi:hypothetical protein
MGVQNCVEKIVSRSLASHHVIFAIEVVSWNFAQN